MSGIKYLLDTNTVELRKSRKIKTEDHFANVGKMEGDKTP